MPAENPNSDQKGSVEDYGGNFEQIDNRSHLSSFESYHSFIQSVQPTSKATQHPPPSKRYASTSKIKKVVNSIPNMRPRITKLPTSNLLPLEEMHYISVKHH